MDELVNFLTYVFMGLFCYSILKGVVNYILQQEVKSHLREILADMIHEVTVENHGTMQYWFDAESHMFLGQGYTDAEVIEQVKARFPTHVFIIPDKGLLARPDWVFKTEISKMVNIDNS